jgi:TatD DNase family protein
MLVDSHCHLDFPELSQNLDTILSAMKQSGVGAALCAGVTLEAFPAMLRLVEPHANLWAAVGVHPDSQECMEPTVEMLVELARHPKVVAIGETGLDYYRLGGDLGWQQARFRTHIRAAKATDKPLIVHTRSAAADTLRIMEEEGAGRGVMHCFTESLDIARHALELGFHISFSGIITFKNAQDLRDIARHVPLDRLLVETDSPYLAPVPYRGKINQPAYVRHVAETIAKEKNISIQEVEEATSSNFFSLFSHAKPV